MISRGDFECQLDGDWSQIKTQVGAKSSQGSRALSWEPLATTVAIEGSCVDLVNDPPFSFFWNPSHAQGNTQAGATSSANWMVIGVELRLRWVQNPPREAGL